MNTFHKLKPGDKFKFAGGFDNIVYIKIIGLPFDAAVMAESYRLVRLDMGCATDVIRIEE